MGLIVHAACVNLCTCGQHGFIVFGDGSKTPEFFTREDALVANKITHAEDEFLREIVRESRIMSKEEMECLKKEFAHLMPSAENGEEPSPPEPDIAHRRDLH